MLLTEEWEMCRQGAVGRKGVWQNQRERHTSVFSGSDDALWLPYLPRGRTVYSSEGIMKD